MTATYNTIPIFSLKVVQERGVRYQYPQVGYVSIASAILASVLQDRDTEHLAVLLVDNQQNNLGVAIVGQGSMERMNTSLRDIFKHAILHRAHAIILGHNHPSGNVEPSSEDIDFTTRVAQMGTMLSCPLLDHVIVSSGINRGSTYSFSEHGKL